MENIPNHGNNRSVYEEYKDREMPKVLLSQVNWEELRFYKKSDVIYQMTVVFCRRFLPRYGDRTVDQMVQAARSCKQNIVEGLADGVTSTKMQMKLLNVARASINELREDYRDYLIANYGAPWERGHGRFQPMMEFCRKCNELSDYKPYLERWDAETFANTGLTICHMIDAMMNRFIKGKEAEFVKYGGIHERMHAARTGYRQGQDERLAFLEQENAQLREEIKRQKGIIERFSK